MKTFVLLAYTAMFLCFGVIAKPAAVKIVSFDGKAQLQVDNQPYFIRGAGVNWVDGNNLSALKAAGGNTFRTWSTNHATEELEQARELGLKVVMGIDLKKQLHGFDYNDSTAVAMQFESVKRQVLKYKDHPNLLAWMVANEPNLLFDVDGNLADVNPKVYQAIADIVDFIHEVDPHHPVSFSFAGVNPRHVEAALAYASNIDFLSFQVYGDLNKIPELVAALPTTKPFMITEFGPIGHWERPITEWGREIEELSGPKAIGLFERMKTGLRNDSGRNIGHFVFEWGQKQERTPTWYGMFHKNGQAMPRIDEVTRYWTGKYPKNRAPSVWSMVLNDKTAQKSVKLATAVEAEVKVTFDEPDGDPTIIVWELSKEVGKRSQGGALEIAPEHLKLEVLEQKGGEKTAMLRFRTPEISGEYRLFCYVYDNHQKVGYANFPFLVK